MEYIIYCIEKSISCKKEILQNKNIIGNIERAASLIAECLSESGKVILCGNGGSAADSQHIAAEFVSRFEIERGALAAVALTTDTSALTAIGNDYGFEYLFSRQLEAIGRKGDVLVGISTSGGSKNVLDAFKKAADLGIKTIGLTGANGFKCDADYLAVEIKIPSSDTARIQECHIMMGHIMVGLAERKLQAF